MATRARLLFGAPMFVGVVLVSATLLAGSTVAVPAGFQVSDRFEFAPRIVGGLGGLAFTPAGDPMVYEGGEIRIHRSGGPVVLTTFDPMVFGSFLVVAPDERFVYFGESSEGNIYRISLDGGTREVVDSIRFNYDLVFDHQGRGFVSASPESQEILLLDEDPTNEQRVVISGIPGLSGPLAMDGSGNLYYGTADFSGDVERQSLHRFSTTQLEAALVGDPIDFYDGETLITGFPGFNHMVFHAGSLYVTELGFASGTGAVIEIDTVDFFFENLATFHLPSGGLASPTLMALRPGERDFAVGSGPLGGELLVAYSDFATVSNLAKISPELYFVRGEANGDGRVDISDAISLLLFLFLVGDAPPDIEATDVNADAVTDLSDAVYLLNFLFLGEAPPTAPFPEWGPAQ